MVAGTAEQARETQTRFKVNHARQVVDQVTLLRERVERQEKAIETVIEERDRALECCDRQRVLIAQLLKKINDPSFAHGKDGDFENLDIDFLPDLDTGNQADDADNGVSSRGGQFGQQQSGKTTIRVNSMRAALLRIGGIEISDGDDRPGNIVEDVFDAAEFQPIADDKKVLVKMKDAIANGFAKVSPFKRDMTVVESEGLQTSR